MILKGFPKSVTSNERIGVAFGDSVLKPFHPNVQKEPKLCAVCDAHIGFNHILEAVSISVPVPQLHTTADPNSQCPQAIRQLTLLSPTSLQYSRQHQITTRLSRDKIYEHIHWLPSSRVTTTHLIPSCVYFEGKRKHSISFTRAITS